MIKGVSISNKKVKGITINDFNSKQLCWFDVYAPNVMDLKILEHKFKISLVDLKDALDINEKSRLEKGSGCYILYVKGYSQDKLVTLGIFVGKNFILTLHTEKIDCLNDYFRELEHSGFRDGVNSLLYDILDSVAKDFYLKLENMEDEIDKLEEELYSTANEKKVKAIFHIKKRMVYLKNGIVGNRNVLADLKKLNNYVNFEEVYNDFVQLDDMEAIISSRITTSIYLHLSNVNNNINRIMKSLTFLAALATMPIVISSIYGMNIVGLPNAKHPYAFWIMILVMILSVGLTALFLRMKKWT